MFEARGATSYAPSDSYGPARTNTGFCGGALVAGGAKAPNGAGIFSSKVSFDVWITDVWPASQFPTKTRELSPAAAIDSSDHVMLVHASFAEVRGIVVLTLRFDVLRTVTLEATV